VISSDYRLPPWRSGSSRSGGPRRGRHGQPRCHGFSLLEVLVAFAILAVSLGVLMQIFSVGLRNVAVEEGYTRAILLAESKLAGLGIEEPLQPGETTGSFDEEYRWHITVQPYTDGDEAIAAAVGQQRAGPDRGGATAGAPFDRDDVGDNPFAAALSGVTAGQLPVEAFAVRIEVIWGTLGAERSVALNTLRLQPAEGGGGLPQL
jgi:general secretion pathway protein I